MPKKKTSTKRLKLSDAFDELEEIVQEFEEGDVDLENSIEKFKIGLELSKYLKKRLNEIENEIVEIKDEFEEESTDKQPKNNKKTKKRSSSQEEIEF